MLTNILEVNPSNKVNRFLHIILSILLMYNCLLNLIFKLIVKKLIALQYLPQNVWYFSIHEIHLCAYVQFRTSLNTVFTFILKFFTWLIIFSNSIMNGGILPLHFIIAFYYSTGKCVGFWILYNWLVI